MNKRIANHPLVGTEHTYRPDLPAYDPDLPENRKGGRIIVGNGMRVQVKAVFEDWNGIAGLDILYVFCPATGEHTHLSPKEITGWDAENTATMVLTAFPSAPCDGLPLHLTKCTDKSAHM